MSARTKQLLCDTLILKAKEKEVELKKPENKEKQIRKDISKKALEKKEEYTDRLDSILLNFNQKHTDFINKIINESKRVKKV